MRVRLCVISCSLLPKSNDTFADLRRLSQSLALVIQDKHRRYQKSDSNPLSGRLQMVTVPPIYPALLRAIEEGTDFYQVRL